MTSRRVARPDGKGRGLAGRAFVWKRYDFRESSRIVVLWLREHGLVAALAKGAHRDSSPLRGRIDFLAELDVQLTATREGLRTLLRAELLRERRGLRAASRFVAASHLAELFDFALVQDRPEPELFDLADGALALLEKCPLASVPNVVLGIELRLLANLGALPDLDRCSTCDRELDGQAFFGEVAGALCCRNHAASPRRAIGAVALGQLRTLLACPGRELPTVAERPTAAAVSLPALWLARSLERRCTLRKHVFARAAAVDETA